MKEQEIFIVVQDTIIVNIHEQVKTNILNVFFTKEDTLKFFGDLIKENSNYKVISPYHRDDLEEHWSDTNLLWLYKEVHIPQPYPHVFKKYKCFRVYSKFNPIPEIMQCWCDYKTMCKINPYTNDAYFYFKGEIEKMTGVEW